MSTSTTTTFLAHFSESTRIYNYIKNVSLLAWHFLVIVMSKLTIIKETKVSTFIFEVRLRTF